MKIQRYAMGMWLALALALAAATAVSTPALAKCYDKLQNEIPCPKTDYKLKQPTATYPTKPTETPTPQALSEQAIVVTPDAAQLAILCANVPGGGSSDAAAVLRALPRFWGRGVDPSRVPGGGSLVVVPCERVDPAFKSNRQIRSLTGLRALAACGVFLTSAESFAAAAPRLGSSAR